MVIKLLVMLSFLVTQTCLATTFARVSLDNQISESDSILIGHFLSQQSVRVEDGSIATQMSFQLTKEFGLESQLFGLEEIIIHYPGGTLGEESVYIDGVPRFTAGEKVALLAKNIDNRFWGLNLALGSYRVINYGNETLLVNDIFPSDPQVSQIKIADFEEKIKSIKGSSLKVVKSNMILPPTQSSAGKNRSIASIDSPVENQGEESSRPSNFWLLAFFACAGAIGGYRLKNKS